MSKSAKEGQFATEERVDLSLVSKDEALKMAENDQLNTRNILFLGEMFNFGSIVGVWVLQAINVIVKVREFLMHAC